MQAGKLRHRILIQKPAGSGDSVTDNVPDYVDVAWRSASVRPVTVKEIFAAQGYLGQLDLMVTIRYEPKFDDLDNTWRLWFQNRKFFVIGKLNEGERDRWLKISATADQDDIRLRNKNFDQPLHYVVHEVLPDLKEADP